MPESQLLSWWTDADWVVRGVFIALIIMSVAGWTLILAKAAQFSRVLRLERALAADLDRDPAGGMARLRRHEGPIAALAPLLCLGLPADAEADRLWHGVREQRQLLESGLSVLASIGNVAPFVGLLGTVWGIMHALEGLSGAEALSMALVAGPVAEALVATAAGLFAAIPAVLGYNFLLRRLARVTLLLEGNAQRLLHLPHLTAAGSTRPEAA